MSNELYARIATLEAATLEAAALKLVAMAARLDARVQELESRKYFLDMPVAGTAFAGRVVCTYPIRVVYGPPAKPVPPAPDATDSLRNLEFDD